MRIKYDNNNRIFAVHTDGIPYLSVRMLDTLGVPNLYSTRFKSYDPKSESGAPGMRVVVMKDEDPAQAASIVFKGRNDLARQLGSSIERECVTDQMHTNQVYQVREEDLGPILREDKPPHRRSIDGIITDLPDVLLTAFGGDCPPVYIADPVRKAVGLVHAGWKGTLGKIPLVCIEKMQEAFGSRPEDLYAAIGPGICMDCYEMGDEIYDLFADQWGSAQADRILRRYPGGKYHLDLREANRMSLLAAGLAEERIAVSNVCTKCNADVFYSYRAHRMENEQAAMIVNRFADRGGPAGV